MLKLRHSQYVARSQRGQHTAEFAATLVVLICVIVIPLLDLSVIPMRRALAQQLVGQSMQKLRLAQTPSEAVRQLEQTENLTAGLSRIGGIQLKSSHLTIEITDRNDKEKWTVEPPQKIPQDWLPEGKRCPCIYMLTLTAEMDTYPLFLVSLGDQKIPGLSAPIPTIISTASVFENQGRNPVTGNYYLNE